jgi:polyhydroxyalkanoate synthesis regulator phasin
MADKFKLQDKLPDFMKELWTGTLDAFYKTEDDVRNFINKMVERGKMTPEEGKKILNEMLGKFKENRQKLEKRASGQIEKTLHMINLPTKTEIDALNKKVSILTRKINKLKKEVAA